MSVVCPAMAECRLVQTDCHECQHTYKRRSLTHLRGNKYLPATRGAIIPVVSGVHTRNGIDSGQLEARGIELVRVFLRVFIALFYGPPYLGRTSPVRFRVWEKLRYLLAFK